MAGSISGDAPLPLFVKYKLRPAKAARLRQLVLALDAPVQFRLGTGPLAPLVQGSREKPATAFRVGKRKRKEADEVFTERRERSPADFAVTKWPRGDICRRSSVGRAPHQEVCAGSSPAVCTTSSAVRSILTNGLPGDRRGRATETCTYGGANRRQPTRSGDSLERQTNIGANVPRLARRSPKPLGWVRFPTVPAIEILGKEDVP